MSLLIFERGPRAGTRIALTEFPVTIGRDPENSVILVDDEVSRFHFRIKKRGRLFIIEDLESRNGTYINGDRVLNSIVQNGDKILLGQTEMRFVTSEPDIQLATEILNYNMVVADDLGIRGPIDVGRKTEQDQFTPIRLNQQSIVNQLTDGIKAVKEIYELHSNILVIHDLEEASKTLLKSLGTIMPSASRAAFFLWADSTRQLIPAAVRHFTKKKEKFLLSQRSLEDVIARKQGVLLQAQSPLVTQSGRNRVILPITHNDTVICVIHIESDNPTKSFTPQELELVQALLCRCAPSFEAMLLRREIDTWMVGMVETMIATIEAKDTYTHGHSERVSRYCMVIADELRLNRDLKRLLLVSALCHDIGKIGIPDSILKKASLLSAEEYDEMKLHPTIGAEIIGHMPNAHRFISGVKHHHEKWDGTGYPDGLAGEDIPFFGRIVAIADVFDAMVSGRSYSGFIDQNEAVTRLDEERDLFDPEILKAFIRAHENGTLRQKTDTANNRPEVEGEDDTEHTKPNPTRLILSKTGKKAQ
jgi:HD-GYP domain-containing protein (c-di-GMP phosphodiesterase class II)